MSSATVFSIQGHRKSVETAIRWLEQSKHDAVLLGLPQDLEHFVQAYALGEISEDELWNSYQLMTGLLRPLADSFRSKLKPLLKYLSTSAHKRKAEVYCYDDLATHVHSGKFAERILLLSYRGRVCSDIDLEEWRQTLVDELRIAQSTWKRSVEDLVEKTFQNVENAIFYEGLLGPLVKYLRQSGVSIRAVHMLSYWRAPLDALRTAASLRGDAYLTEENIRRAVELHMKYLDTVISSDDLDESEKKWAQMASFRKGFENDATTLS